jgi:hypothetical protein
MRHRRATVIRLSDSELDAIMSAAAPLDRDLRDPFLRAVADELARHETIGPGTVYRVAREQQGKFFRPPISDEHGSRAGIGKYARL